MTAVERLAVRCDALANVVKREAPGWEMEAPSLAWRGLRFAAEALRRGLPYSAGVILDDNYHVVEDPALSRRQEDIRASIEAPDSPTPADLDYLCDEIDLYDRSDWEDAR